MIKANLLPSSHLRDMRERVAGLKRFVANPAIGMTRTELQLLEHINTLSDMVLFLTEPIVGQENAGK